MSAAAGRLKCKTEAKSLVLAGPLGLFATKLTVLPTQRRTLYIFTTKKDNQII